MQGLQAVYWQPSARLLQARCALALLAMLALQSARLPGWVAGVCALLALGYAIGCLRMLQRRTHARFRLGLRHGAAGWQMWSPVSGWQTLRLKQGSLVVRWLIVLYGRAGRRPVSCVLPADVLPAESHRRLRVWLRLRVPKA